MTKSTPVFTRAWIPFSMLGEVTNCSLFPALPLTSPPLQDAACEPAHTRQYSAVTMATDQPRLQRECYQTALQKVLIHKDSYSLLFMREEHELNVYNLDTAALLILLRSRLGSEFCCPGLPFTKSQTSGQACQGLCNQADSAGTLSQDLFF